MEVTETLLNATGSVVLAVMVVVLVDFLRLPRSRYSTWTDAFLLYLLLRVGTVRRFFEWRQFVRDSNNLLEAQEWLVLGQVRANASSAYGRDHGFSSIGSLADFRRTQPLTSFSDFEPYVARVAAGEATAMFGSGRAPVLFGCSSGTTGGGKRIPISNTAAALNSGRNVIALLAAAIPDSGLRSLRLQLNTFCAPRWRHTEAGVKVGSVVAGMMLTRAYRLQSTLPDAALEVSDATAASHVGLLFALRDDQVERMQGSLVSYLLEMLQYLERHWRRLVSDLRRGQLDEAVPLTAEVRAALDKLLHPEPDRATQLETEFSKGFDNILSRIFPHLRMITARYSGSSMAVYKERCMAYTGNVPIHSDCYVCTEAFIGINMRPSNEQPGYTLLPKESYIEFLPVDGEGRLMEGEELLQAHQVQLGRLYELVLTNLSGLYRYRLGDVVQVVGFYNQIPKIDFQFRTGQMLNVHSEKLSEASFTAALLSAAGRWPGLRLSDFTAAESVLAPDTEVEPTPRYLVFTETEGGTPTERQRHMVDEALCDQHYVYKSFRVKNAIGPMKVIPVSEGTFLEYREHLKSSSFVFGQQIKQPRVLRTEWQVQFFLDRRLPAEQ